MGGGGGVDMIYGLEILARYKCSIRPSWFLARQQPMLKLEVEYFWQLEDVKRYYFLPDGTKHNCKPISKNQAN